jgi:hypothetical protein
MQRNGNDTDIHKPYHIRRPSGTQLLTIIIIGKPLTMVWVKAPAAKVGYNKVRSFDFSPSVMHEHGFTLSRRE